MSLSTCLQQHLQAYILETYVIRIIEEYAYNTVTQIPMCSNRNRQIIHIQYFKHKIRREPDNTWIVKPGVYVKYSDPSMYSIMDAIIKITPELTFEPVRDARGASRDIAPIPFECLKVFDTFYDELQERVRCCQMMTIWLQSQMLFVLTEDNCLFKTNVQNEDNCLFKTNVQNEDNCLFKTNVQNEDNCLFKTNVETEPSSCALTQCLANVSWFAIVDDLLVVLSTTSDIQLYQVGVHGTLFLVHEYHFRCPYVFNRITFFYPSIPVSSSNVYLSLLAQNDYELFLIQ